MKECDYAGFDPAERARGIRAIPDVASRPSAPVAAGQSETNGPVAAVSRPAIEGCVGTTGFGGMMGFGGM